MTWSTPSEPPSITEYQAVIKDDLTPSEVMWELKLNATGQDASEIEASFERFMTAISAIPDTTVLYAVRAVNRSQSYTP